MALPRVVLFETLVGDFVERLRNEIGRFTPAGLLLLEIDISKGVGLLTPHSKCAWTYGGHRVTFTSSSQSAIRIELSKEYDPQSDPMARQWTVAYCVKGECSDVHAFISSANADVDGECDRSWRCGECTMECLAAGESIVFRTPGALLAHLAIHVERGHRVPLAVIDMLNRERSEEGL